MILKKSIYINLAAFALLFLTGFLVLALVPSDNSEKENLHQGFALVELFTSEGCSSCPPADRLFNELLEEAEQTGKKVYGLAFHVDYWNYLGWKDPYSQKAWSTRQRAYAQKFGNGRVYTPQMVVNGKTEFVGSDYRKATTSIKTSLSQQNLLQINLKPTIEKNQLTVNYSIEGQATNSHIRIALVENGIEEKIARGENRGRTLKHSHVVRDMQSRELNTSQGEIYLNIPNDLDRPQAQVIAFIQHNETWNILAANATDL